MITLAHPLWLLLLPAPALVWWLLRRGRWPIFKRKSGAAAAAGVIHPYADLLHNLAADSGPARSRFPWLWMLGCSLLVIALARPLWLDEAQPGWHSGRDIMLAIDVSGSMRALDFTLEDKPVSRLAMLKHVVDEFLQQRHGDRVGLVVFADDAYTLVPVTADAGIARRMVKGLRHGVIGEKTALGPAIALAVKRLKERQPAARLLILLTDGTHTTGEIRPDTALALARHYNVRIYTLGIGSNKEVLFPKGPAIDPELTRLPLDEALLTRIAETTGGQYFRVGRTGDMTAAIRAIEQLETIDIADRSLPPRAEWYWLPLLLGLALLGAHHLRRRGEVMP